MVVAAAVTAVEIVVAEVAAAVSAVALAAEIAEAVAVLHLEATVVDFAAIATKALRFEMKSPVSGSGFLVFRFLGSHQNLYTEYMRLSAIQSPQGAISLLELDTPLQTAAAIGLDASVPQNQQLVASMYREMLKVASATVSGICVEPELSLPLFLEVHSILKTPPLASHPGLVIRLDTPSSDAITPQTMPAFSQTWGVEHIANNYALALLELQYHPHEPEALAKKQLVAELNDFCRHQHIDLVVKLLIPRTGADLAPAQLQELQLQAIQELGRSCQLLALEAPADSLAAATLTAELDIPWIMIGNQSDLSEFDAQLQLCLENGARGFIAGSVLWPELQQRRPDMGVDLESVKGFISQQLSGRLKSIVQKTNEAVVT